MVRFLLLVVASASLFGCGGANEQGLERFIIKNVVIPNRLVPTEAGRWSVQERTANQYMIIAQGGGNTRSLGDGDRLRLDFEELTVIPVRREWADKHSDYVSYRSKIKDGEITAAGRVRLEFWSQPGNKYMYRLAGSWDCVYGTMEPSHNFIGEKQGWKCQRAGDEFSRIFNWAKRAQDLSNAPG